MAEIAVVHVARLALGARRGTRIRYRLSERSRVRLRIARFSVVAR